MAHRPPVPPTCVCALPRLQPYLVQTRVSNSVALISNLAAQGHTLCTCVVVLAEVRAGLSPREWVTAETLLTSLHFLPASAHAGAQAGDWRYAYARRGVTLSTTDCLIAATAAEHGATIVTGNIRDFPMPEVATVVLPRPARKGRRN